MPIDVAVLDRALGLFRGADSPAMAGAFQDLTGSVSWLDEQASPAVRAVRAIVGDLWTLETVMLRVDQQFHDLKEGRLNGIVWVFYASADIEFFHVVCRSLFDHIATLILETAAAAARLKRRKRSFQSLREWLRASPESRLLVGEEWSDLVTGCDWFPILRTIRDGIVHKGAQTIVTTVNDGIGFQVMVESKARLYVDELMVNENILEFMAYGGMVYGYLLAFLDAIANVSFRRLEGIRRLSATGQHPAYPVTRQWILRARERAA